MIGEVKYAALRGDIGAVAHELVPASVPQYRKFETLSPRRRVDVSGHDFKRGADVFAIGPGM